MKGGVCFYLAGAVLLLALTGCTLADGRKITMQDDLDRTPLPTMAASSKLPVAVPGEDSYGAAEDYEEVTGSLAGPPRASDTFAPVPPIRMAKKHIYLLLGGFNGADGWVTSAGMLELRSSLAALSDVEVTTYDWSSFKKAADDIALLPKDDIVIVIGYSGGGSRATWLANLPSKPKIDLMVLYDPSPTWQMKAIGANVKRALCYHNITPFFFGLGGGALVSNNTPIETVEIFENHLLVQTDTTLHQRTIAEVKKVQIQVDQFTDHF